MPLARTDEGVGAGTPHRLFVADRQCDLPADHVEALLRVVVEVDRRAAATRRSVPFEDGAGAVAIRVQVGEPETQEVEALRLGRRARHLPKANSVARGGATMP